MTDQSRQEMYEAIYQLERLHEKAMQLFINAVEHHEAYEVLRNLGYEVWDTWRSFQDKQDEINASMMREAMSA